MPCDVDEEAADTRMVEKIGGIGVDIKSNFRLYLPFFQKVGLYLLLRHC
jgi:hypothetical protein